MFTFGLLEATVDILWLGWRALGGGVWLLWLHWWGGFLFFMSNLTALLEVDVALWLSWGCNVNE